MTNTEELNCRSKKSQEYRQHLISGYNWIWHAGLSEM